MPAPISVVIPTLNAADALPETLAALMEGLSAGLIREVILTDGGSGDATRRIAEDVGAVWITGAPSRGGQLRRGCAQARAPWLLVLHADTHLASGWSRVVQGALADPGRAYTFRLAFRASGVAPAWTAGWANLRTRSLGMPYGDQGLLVARSLYEAVGGFPDVPLMEDVSVVRALPEAPRMLPIEARTSAARYQAEGWLARGGRNLWTMLRYLAGTAPERLAEDYARRGRAHR